MLREKFANQYSYFSSGDLFRALTSTDNTVGNYLTDRLASGKLIDDKVANALFELYFYTVCDQHKAMMLDGYPRSISQMEMMLDIFHRNQREVVAIHFILPEHIARERMKARGRNDDTDEGIQKRIAQYHATTEPMITKFRTKMQVIDIDATGEIADVHGTIMKIVS